MILLQALVLNKVHIVGLGTPLLYIWLLLKENSGVSPQRLMLEAFVLGLAVDIVARDYQLLDERQEETAEQQWLMKNCWRYGFILRYPTDKTEETGIIYEPWHYRYVGREAAEEITRQEICLEEYLGYESS